MPYVYKYTDLEDNIVKYVGLIRKESNFPNRFKQHLRDDWCKDGSWKIEYMEVKTICDAEMLEAHLIEHYHTREWYNTAKATWGECSYAPADEKMHWIEWLDLNSLFGTAHLSNAPDYQYALSMLTADTDRLLREIDTIYERIDSLRKHMRRQRRASIRAWFDSRPLYSVCQLPVDCHYCGNHICEKYPDDMLTTKEDAYKDYCKFLFEAEQENLYEFIDADELWEEMLDMGVCTHKGKLKGHLGPLNKSEEQGEKE